MVGGLFTGKMKWLNVLTIFIQIAWFVCAVYFAIRFFNAIDIAEMIKFGAIAFFFRDGCGNVKTLPLDGNPQEFSNKRDKANGTSGVVACRKIEGED